LSLLIEPRIISGEGPTGYEARIAAANALARSELISLGIPVLTVNRRDDPAVEVELSDAWNYPRRVDLLRTNNADSWIRYDRKFCPHCLAEAQYWRLEWELLFVDACPVHQVWLLDKCEICSSRFSWNAGGFLRCVCGAELVNQSTRAAPFAVATLAQAIAKTALEETGPLKLVNTLSVRQLVRLIRFLGAYGNGVLRSRPQKILNMARLETSWPMVTAAAEILFRWPAAFQEMLGNLLKNPVNTGTGRLYDHFGHFYWSLYRAFPEHEFEFLRKEFEDFLIEHWQGAMGRRNRRLAEDMTSRMAWLPFARACQLTGWSRRKLQSLINDGAVRSEARQARSGRRFVVVARDSIDHYKTDEDEFVDLLTAARLLGITKRRATAIVPMLICNTKNTLVPNGRWTISRSAIDKILSLRDGCSTSSGDMNDNVALSTVFRFWKWTNAELASLLTDAVAGRVRPCERNAEMGIMALVFRKQELLQWKRDFATRAELLGVPEVALKLKIKQEVAYYLVCHGWMSVSRHSSNGGALISLKELERFSKEFVFARDLSRRFSCSPRGLIGALAKESIFPIDSKSLVKCRQKVFYRAQIEKQFGQPEQATSLIDSCRIA
jgi:TniQ